ncbi:unnamed protein product [Heterobilharzia americana]|nr:unnamed protein product [Heterobilharzia americana]
MFSRNRRQSALATKEDIVANFVRLITLWGLLTDLELSNMSCQPLKLKKLNVEETKRYIENYKKENKDIIKKNRTRPSLSLAFYDSELERESILREKREQEEEEEESQPKGLQKACTPEDSSSLITTGSKGEKRREMVPPTPRTNMLNTPSSTVGRRPPTTFIPPSVYAPPSFIVPPTQTSGYAPALHFPSVHYPLQ